MTDDLKKQLGAYGQLGTRGSDHPYSVVCREALARITELENVLVDLATTLNATAAAQVAELEGQLAAAEALALEYEHRHQRALSLLHEAEAGEDALAEALRERDGGVHGEDCRSHRLNMGMFAQSCNCGHEDALDALAAYEARRKG